MNKYLEKIAASKGFKMTSPTSGIDHAPVKSGSPDVKQSFKVKSTFKMPSPNKAIVKQATAADLAKSIGKKVVRVAKGTGQGLQDYGQTMAGGKVKEHGVKNLGLKGKKLEKFMESNAKKKLQIAQSSKSNIGGQSSSSNTKELKSLLNKQEAARTITGVAATAGAAKAATDQGKKYNEKRKAQNLYKQYYR